MRGKKKSSKTPTPEIIIAASDGDLEAVRAELKKSTEVNAVDRDGGTALHQAACNHHVEVVKALLRAGATANIADGAGRTPLHFAARELQTGIAKLLLDAGAEVDAQDEHGSTPLAEAVFATEDDPAMIRLLIAAGANRNRKNKSGVSPRSLAREVDHPNLAKWVG